MRAARRFTATAILIFSAAVVTATQTVQVNDASPEAAKLASLDAKSRTVLVANVRQMEKLIADVAGKCTISKGSPGDLAVTAVRGLQKSGKTVTIAQFLKAMSDSIPKEIDRAAIKCETVAVTVWTIMERQN